MLVHRMSVKSIEFHFKSNVTGEWGVLVQECQ